MLGFGLGPLAGDDAADDRADGIATDSACACRPSFADGTLVLDAADCPGDGDLAAREACRATAVTALEARDAEAIVSRAAGLDRRYDGRAAALLVAAGRFAARVAPHDDRLADRARRDPLGAAHEAGGRAGPAARLTATTGLALAAEGLERDDGALAARVGPTLARSHVALRPPPDARLLDRHDLPTGAVARRYECGQTETAPGIHYHLLPVEATLDRSALATLARAHERLAAGDARPPDEPPSLDESAGPAAVEADRGAVRAVRAVADDDTPVETLAAVLSKHAAGVGVLADLFADPDVTDVFATAPVAANPLRVRADGTAMPTNVYPTTGWAGTLASRFRRASGRAFGRADPTLDAVADVGGRRVRVAGITAPVSDGDAFAFRAHDPEPFRLTDLVENGTLGPWTAGLLSVAVARGAAVLAVGARGAGKTTLLGALCFAIPAAVRTLVIEDTPELPIAALRADGRDVQRLHADESGPVTAAGAVRTALRLGEGALVVGEVRGEEAAALYEAMRVGETDGAVLGTIHGDGGETVRERVVSDLGVPESAFAATDLVVTCRVRETADGTRRRVPRVEEVVGTRDGVAFAPLVAEGFPTGRIDRGESHVLASLTDDAGDGEGYDTYAAVRAAVSSAAASFESSGAGSGR